MNSIVGASCLYEMVHVPEQVQQTPVVVVTFSSILIFFYPFFFPSHSLSIYLSHSFMLVQEVILKRAADLVEALYGMPHNNQVSISIPANPGKKERKSQRENKCKYIEPG